MIRIVLVSTWIWLCGFATAFGSVAENFDVLIRHGTVVDGSGAPRFDADIGITAGRIVRVGDLHESKGTKEIDARGLIVAPGFIDVHTHVEEGLVKPELRHNRGYVTQGVTTCLIGADGGYGPESIRAFMEVFESQGVGTNYGFLVGHNGIRKDVLGMEDRAPSEAELERMKAQVRLGMELGAVGLSTGLMYLPGRYASTNEVVELARVAAEYGGLYDSHVRNAVPDIEGAYREAIEVGVRSGARPHPAHFKTAGKRNWGRAKTLNDYFQSQIDEGVDITVDVYPYDGAQTAPLMDVFAIPPELELFELRKRIRATRNEPERNQALVASYLVELVAALSDPEQRERIRIATEEGIPGVYSVIATAADGYDTLRVVVSDAVPELEGQMIIEIAERQGKRPFAVMADLLRSNGAAVKVTLAATIEEDIREIITRPWAMIASDGSITGFENQRGHPRSRGTFPRVLGRYVRESGILTLEDAVRKMTSLPAEYYRLGERGLIRSSYWADITIFDPEQVIDRATWREPSRYSEGIVHVLVQGRLVLEKNELTGDLPGQFVARTTGRDPGFSNERKH